MQSKQPNYKKIIGQINETSKQILGEGYEVFVFGSLARRDFENSSDLDIGIKPISGKMDFRKLLRFKSALEDTNLPFEFDVIDFSRVSTEFELEASKYRVLCLDSK